jgi:hypothetical protein
MRSIQEKQQEPFPAFSAILVGWFAIFFAYGLLIYAADSNLGGKNCEVPVSLPLEQPNDLRETQINILHNYVL